jgi:MFS family permease
MMYFLAFIIISPLAATLSDRWQVRRGFIIGGVAWRP